jgi:hypothetical protein
MESKAVLVVRRRMQEATIVPDVFARCTVAFRLNKNGRLLYRRKGTKKDRRACTACYLQDHTNATSANFHHNTLCSQHARKRGVFARNPCEMCPGNAPKTGYCENEAGEHNKLCYEHAVERKTNQCELCPKGTKQMAKYHNQANQLKKLCSVHARSLGTFILKMPCELCPAYAQKRGYYENETGHDKKLCYEHAVEQGTFKTLNPCQLCPEYAKLSASCKNQAGLQNKLCARHAVEAGTIAKCHPGASRVACECWDRLSLLLGRPLDHVHLVPGRSVVEVETRVPGTNYRPDARDATNPMVLYEYLGNPWHGYPPEHELFNDPVHYDSTGDTTHATLYATTMERFQVLSELGYTIMYVWGHEYKQTAVKKCPRGLKSVVREFVPSAHMDRHQQ